ncbi:MAG: hypothetical protein HYV32_00050 [Candidatus Kerfeldbacteria bacterium]|nr:hypothetical protein [Candidatus Kerfeldbacteria bacterium]
MTDKSIKGPLNDFQSTRALVSKLARISKGGFLDISIASQALQTDPKSTAIKLAALVKTGWLLRVKRGLYFILPLEATPGKSMMSEDPWLLAREAFSPCYIGGWSAAEYWGLTDQLFRSTLVITAANIRAKSITLLNHEFRLFQVENARINNAVSIWRGSEQINVSDREQTILDCLRNPELCGGIRHLSDIMLSYKENKEHNFPALLAKAKKHANGASWKRLGYLSELLWEEDAQEIIDEAKKNMTAGNIKLDPNVNSKETLIKRWHLWINVTIINQEHV